MDLPVDARVECTDGHGGRSAHVIVDPRRRRVTHLVVEERRRPHIARLVPIELVTRTDPRTIWLRCTRAELAALDRFTETEYVPPGERDIPRSTRVVATNGPVGRVDEFLVDPHDGAITHLVLREGHLWGQKDVTIPVADIDRIEDDGVYLKLDKLAISALPTVPVGLRS